MNKSWNIKITNRVFRTQIIEKSTNSIKLLINDKEYQIDLSKSSKHNQQLEVQSLFQNQILASIPGKISKIYYAEQENITAGSTLLVIEAMKMENPFKITTLAKLLKLHVKEGDLVKSGDLLAELEEI